MRGCWHLRTHFGIGESISLVDLGKLSFESIIIQRCVLALMNWQCMASLAHISTCNRLFKNRWWWWNFPCSSSASEQEASFWHKDREWPYYQVFFNARSWVLIFFVFIWFQLFQSWLLCCQNSKLAVERLDCVLLTSLSLTWGNILAHVLNGLYGGCLDI